MDKINVETTDWLVIIWLATELRNNDLLTGLRWVKLPMSRRKIVKLHAKGSSCESRNLSIPDYFGH